MLQKHIQHLYWRAGFGESLAVIMATQKFSAKQIFKQMLKDSEHFKPIDVVDMQEVLAELRQLKDMREMKKEGDLAARKDLKDIKKENKEEQGTLNTTWIDLMTTEKSALREKMALFWHGHLVSRSIRPAFSQSYLNTLREHALGKFGDLLLAVSQEPSMLQFLNNKQNKKRSPNENFARELMELFTLGRGNYTEKDIKEVARAFTGWDADFQGRFIFRENQHDEGEKTIFGKTGNFKGEDVIEMILDKKEAAQFITTKIYKYFVNENVDNQRVMELAKRFYKTNYDIADLLENIFTADWFYDEKNIGTHIKSPVELLVGIKRTLGADFEEQQPNLYVQKVLGQVLLYPPNVAGWSGGRNWIDSSSLLFRLQLPALMFSGKESTISAKKDGDVNTEYQSRKRSFKATIDWANFTQAFSAKNENNIEELSQYLLQVPVNEVFKQGIATKIQNESKVEATKKAALALMMMPEYQVC